MPALGDAAGNTRFDAPKVPGQGQGLGRRFERAIRRHLGIWAYMTGRLRIGGDQGLARKLSEISP